MEPSINKIMKSTNIAAAAKRYGLSDDDMWNFYYESGIVFIECLKVNIKHKWIFDRVFKPFSGQIGDMPLPSVFEMIEYSTVFWKWWANHLWCVCFNCPGNYNDMIYGLLSDTILLPNYILKNIINGNEQKSGARQSNDFMAEGKTSSFEREKAEA